MNKLRQLIVNADDYGVTRNVSLGIREAHQQGIVTTTTAIVSAIDENNITLTKFSALGS